MEFLLINSPIFGENNDKNEDSLPPIGLGYIATYLQKNGIETELLDTVKRNMSVYEIIKYIECNKPAYVGINIFTQNYQNVKYIVENCKHCCQWFIGGQCVKYVYTDICKWEQNCLMHLIIGEGEYIIPSIVLNQFNESVIYTYNNVRVYKVDINSKYYLKDISKVNLERSFFENEIIVNHYGKNEIAIVTSRGCIYDCAFCGGARSQNEDVGVRRRSNASIIKELENILIRYEKIESIRILDDLFLKNGNSILDAYDIFKLFPKLEWRAMVHTLSLKNNCDKIPLLHLCNCRELFMGIESGSPEIRKRINKLGSIDDVLNVGKQILENGINLKGYFIYGFPHENRVQFEETFLLAKQLMKISKSTRGKFRTSVFQFRPYHGTRLYNELLEEFGYINNCEFNDRLSQFKGRSQFNFSSGNYSDECDDVLHEYIIKTQELSIHEND